VQSAHTIIILIVQGISDTEGEETQD